jgi:hypothetical protein
MLLIPYLKCGQAQSHCVRDEAVPDHRWPLETQTPAVHAHIFGEAHGLEHLGSEHTAVANLDPPMQERVKGEDLEGRLGYRVSLGAIGRVGQNRAHLGVRVVGGLEP